MSLLQVWLQVLFKLPPLCWDLESVMYIEQPFGIFFAHTFQEWSLSVLKSSALPGINSTDFQSQTIMETLSSWCKCLMYWVGEKVHLELGCYTEKIRMLPEWTFCPNTIPCSSGRTSEAVITPVVCVLPFEVLARLPLCPSSPSQWGIFLLCSCRKSFLLVFESFSEIVTLGVVVVLVCGWEEMIQELPAQSACPPSSLDSINFAPVDF